MREWVGREGGERESGGVRECRVCVRERERHESLGWERENVGEI